MNIRHLTSAGVAIVVAGIVVIVLAVGGSSAKTRPAPAVAAGSAVSVRTTSVGKTLVDAKGRTLYLFEGDRTNVSTLSKAGLAVWPRFIATGTVKALNGAQGAKLGTITSPKGVRQVTYNGHPLYYYAGDSQPGNVKGQRLNEFGGLWYVLAPSGNAVTAAASTSATTTPVPASNSGGGYGY